MILVFFIIVANIENPDHISQRGRVHTKTLSTMVIHWYSKYSKILKRVLLFCFCVDVLMKQREHIGDRRFVSPVFLLRTVRDKFFQRLV